MALVQLKGAAVSDSRLVNRNVVAKRGRTSMRLEPELWQALTEIGEREGKDLSALVRKAEDDDNPGGRTSAVRVFVLDYFRAAATEAGHAAAGHGVLRIEAGRQRDALTATVDGARAAA